MIADALAWTLEHYQLALGLGALVVWLLLEVWLWAEEREVDQKLVAAVDALETAKAKRQLPMVVLWGGPHDGQKKTFPITDRPAPVPEFIAVIPDRGGPRSYYLIETAQTANGPRYTGIARYRADVTEELTDEGGRED